jgi:hypothetical protein
MFHQLKGRQLDNYHRPGYYSRCVKSVAKASPAATAFTNTNSIKEDSQGNESWLREGPLNPPDARNGFPWTVKDWDKFGSQAQDGKD